MRDDRNDAGSKLTYFLAGAGIGAVIALLFANPSWAVLRARYRSDSRGQYGKQIAELLPLQCRRRPEVGQFRTRIISIIAQTASCTYKDSNCETSNKVKVRNISFQWLTSSADRY